MTLTNPIERIGLPESVIVHRGPFAPGMQAIVDDSLAAVGLPKALTVDVCRPRRVRVGLGYRMSCGSQPAGMYPDEATGFTGYVVKVCKDDNVEIEGDNGKVLFVHAGRVETLPPEHSRNGIPAISRWDILVGGR